MGGGSEKERHWNELDNTAEAKGFAVSTAVRRTELRVFWFFCELVSLQIRRSI